MKIFDQIEVEAELSEVKGIDDGLAFPDRANYDALSSENFELLLYSVYKANLSSDDWYDNLRLMITGADQGRDIWLTYQEKPVGLIQCKRVKPGFTAPEAIREVIKFLLNAELEPSLLPDPNGFRFILAVSSEPAGTTTDFFQTPLNSLDKLDDDLKRFTETVISTYTHLSKLDINIVLPKVKSSLRAMCYTLHRSVDLDEMLESLPHVRQRFFRVKLVIGIDENKAAIREELAGWIGIPSLLRFSKNIERSEIERASRSLAEWSQVIWGQHIDRPELAQLVRRIIHHPSAATLVVGGAGTGKSALLAELYADLKCRGYPVLAIKADMLDVGIRDFEALAHELKISGSIDEGFLRLAAEHPCALIIDQLDAVSEVMDQHSQRMQVLLRLATRLLSTKRSEDQLPLPVHVIVSSRPFEANFDARFSLLNAEQIELALPLFEQVEVLLRCIGIDPTEVPDSLKETLRTPFALGVYVDLVKAGATPRELTSANLLDRWLDKKLPTGSTRREFLDFLRQFAADMTTHETLWRPAAYYEPDQSEYVRDAEAMGVIVRDGANVGFSHQSWLDDFQAKSFRSAADIVTYAWNHQDGLFARGTVLRGLERLRRLHMSAYEEAVRTLLSDGKTRRHLRHLVVDILSCADIPTKQEFAWLDWLARGDKILAQRALQNIVSRWPIWREGALPLLPFLMQDDQLLWHAALLLTREAEVDAERTMDLIECYWAEGHYDEFVFRVFSGAVMASDRAIRYLHTIFNRTLFAESVVGHYAKNLSANGKANKAIDVIAFWVATQTEERYQGIKMYELEEVAAASPLYFVQRFLPWFVQTAGKETDRGRLGHWFPRSASLSYDWKSGYEQGYVGEVLRKMLATSASHHPNEIRVLLSAIMEVEIDEVQSIIADTFAANPQVFAVDALEFLLADNRRFNLSLDTFNDDHGVSHIKSGWSSNNLIAQIVAFLDKSSIARLRDQIEAWWPWQEKLKKEKPSLNTRRQYWCWTEEQRFHLLAELPKEHLSARRRRQIEEWKLNQPKLVVKVNSRMMARFAQSPMSHVKMLKATDDEIFAMLNELHDGTSGHRHPRDFLRGGVNELSNSFAALAKADPAKALRIISSRLEAGKHEQAAGKAIRELAALEEQNPLEIKQLIWQLHQQGFSSPSFRQDVTDAWQKLAERLNGLSNEDVDLLRSWLQRDENCLVSETFHNAGQNQFNRERNEKSGQAPREILFASLDGFRVIPQNNFTILSAIASGYLLRKEIDCDGWLEELEMHIEYPEASEVWTSIFISRSHELWWADPVRLDSLIKKVWRRFPAAFDDCTMIRPLWHLRARMSQALQLELIHYWENHSDHKLRQAAGEFAAALAIVGGREEAIFTPIVEDFLARDEEYTCTGVLFAAANGWRESDTKIRLKSHSYLLSVASTVSGSLAHALSSAVNHNERFEADELTRELLTAIKDNTDLLEKSLSRSFMQSLEGLLLYPSFEGLVLEIVEKMVDLVFRTRKSVGLRYEGELVGLAIALQRSVAEIKLRAMTVYEKLLDAQMYEAEEAARQALRR